MNYIQDYESAIGRLDKNCTDQNTQHQAVLALTRMGSLDFACREYKRYGLDKVRHHEDIMALGGRLSKDYYLSTTGTDSREHARASAAKYEAAFKDTQGHYSGINAASMAFLADMPAQIISDRINAILSILPSTDILCAEDHYFMQATRSECYLLKGEINKAKGILQTAIAFDPLNYAAHATTLKQFEMILAKSGKDKTWLGEFTAPQSMHFAGHIWPSSDVDFYTSAPQITDMIQEHDIGFGYGALAAGADIMIAEALLNQGAELHIVLPSPIDPFMKNSVSPYGQDWKIRFNHCLNRASSVICLPTERNVAEWNQAMLGGRVAMGQAIMNGQRLNSSALQLLIHDPQHDTSMSAMHKRDWERAGLDSVDLHVEHKINIGERPLKPAKDIAVLVANLQTQSVQKHDTFDQAINAIQPSDCTQTYISFDFPGAAQNFETLMSHDKTETNFVSEAIASYATLMYMSKYKSIFAGIVKDDTDTAIRLYTLQKLL